MRRSAVTVIVLAAGVALAGCGSSGKGGTAAPSAAGSSSAAQTGDGPSAGGGAGAGASGAATGSSTGATGNGGGGTGNGNGSGTPCVVGTWKTTGLAGSLTGNGVSGTVKGGGGIVMTVAPGGATSVRFDGMQPLAFSYAVGGGSVTGTFSYGGSIKGAVKLPAGAVTSGTWSPAGTVDFSPLTVTVDITNPAVGKVADKEPLADFVSSSAVSAGAAIDAQPLLKAGQFTCSGSTLTIAPPAGGTGIGTWTLAKA